MLDGLFISKLSNLEELSPSRLTDEMFFDIIEGYSLGKLDGDWKGKIIESKGLLSKGLNFDSCNHWIETSKFFAEQVLTKPTQHDVALRCFYLSLSFLAVGIDYMLKELSFLDVSDRVEKLVEGFTYGSRGKEGLEKMLGLSLGLVEQFTHDGRSMTNQIKSKVYQQFDALPTNILGEYFGKKDTGKTLFEVARELESLSMNKNFVNHSGSTIELRSLIGCVLDYWGLSRQDFNKVAEVA